MSESEEVRLRPDDFRRSWANALVLAMEEGANLIEAIREQHKISAGLQVEINRLSEDFLKKRSDLEKAIKDTTSVFTLAAMHFHGFQKIGEEIQHEFRRTAVEVQTEIRATGLDVSAQINAALSVVQRESTELEQQRTLLNTQRAELAKAQRDFTQARSAFFREKDDFSKMTLWERLNWRS